MVVGTSEPQEFQLLQDGVPLNGTGFSVAIEFRGGVGEPTAPTLSVAWLDQAAGTVRVSGVEIMIVERYHFRFKLTDAGAKVGYIPNLASLPNVWNVVRV